MSLCKWEKELGQSLGKFGRSLCFQTNLKNKNWNMNLKSEFGQTLGGLNPWTQTLHQVWPAVPTWQWPTYEGPFFFPSGAISSPHPSCEDSSHPILGIPIRRTAWVTCQWSNMGFPNYSGLNAIAPFLSKLVLTESHLSLSGRIKGSSEGSGD